jgi:hypothetical protein
MDELANLWSKDKDNRNSAFFTVIEAPNPPYEVIVKKYGGVWRDERLSKQPV